MFMDMSSELVHSLLPIFMVGTLGASMATVGVIEIFFANDIKSVMWVAVVPAFIAVVLLSVERSLTPFFFY
jgi:hypothetical protein